jgi:hypothetical protein
MPGHKRLVLAAALLGIVLALCAGCGGGREDIVRIERAPYASISKGVLAHWMEVFAGSDFRTSIGQEGPAGLATEPANYPRCIAAAKLVAPRSFFNQLRRTRPQLDATCHALHAAITAQALSFLISAQWAIVESRELGLRTTAAAVDLAFARTRRQAYPTEAALHAYLTQRHWSLADLLYMIRAALLESATLAHTPETPISTAVPQPLEQPRSDRSRLIRRTICKAGYVVAGCSGYQGATSVSKPPGEILRELVGAGALPKH